MFVGRCLSFVFLILIASNAAMEAYASKCGPMMFDVSRLRASAIARALERNQPKTAAPVWAGLGDHIRAAKNYESARLYDEAAYEWHRAEKPEEARRAYHRELSAIYESIEARQAILDSEFVRGASLAAILGEKDVAAFILESWRTRYKHQNELKRTWMEDLNRLRDRKASSSEIYAFCQARELEFHLSETHQVTVFYYMSGEPLILARHLESKLTDHPYLKMGAKRIYEELRLGEEALRVQREIDRMDEDARRREIFERYFFEGAYKAKTPYETTRARKIFNVLFGEVHGDRIQDGWGNTNTEGGYGLAAGWIDLF